MPELTSGIDRSRVNGSVLVNLQGRTTVTRDEQGQTTFGFFSWKFPRIPTWLNPCLVRLYPDLVQVGVFALEIKLGVEDARARTHNLHVTGLGAAQVAAAVTVRDCTFTDIGYDLHILVRVRIKPCACLDDVIIDNPQSSKPHTLGVVVVGKTKVMPRVQPTMVGVTELLKGISFNHDNLQKHCVKTFMLISYLYSESLEYSHYSLY